MLNGIDPIIIFQFAKQADPSFIGPQNSQIGRVPIISQIPTLVEEPPIPIYLSQRLTGLYIDSEDKNIDINTEVQTLSNGEPPDINQKGIASSITVNLIAKKNSIGIVLMSAMMDRIFDKLTSKEYSVSYLHGSITIFRGVIQNFKLSQNSDTDLLQVSFEISKGQKQPEKPSGITEVGSSQGVVPLATGG